MFKSHASLLALVAAAALSACAVTPSETSSVGSSSEAVQSSFERDRQAILAMAGTFDVKFDFIETVALAEGYEIKDRKLSGAWEHVEVVEDRGDYISLQHILYVGGGDNRFALKHWRQDWQYEPEKVLNFIGGNAWTTRAVSREERRGAWSQEVYQVDDSPRYGAVGQWGYTGGIASWEAAREWRPLPRRDMTTRDDYHAVDAMNRHTITPDGWVHEQDNTKTVLTDGTPQALVREIAVNTYKRTDKFSPADIQASWAATKDYWAGVRVIWEEFEEVDEPFALTLKGEPMDLYMALLGYGGLVEEGEMGTDEAIQEAKVTIEQYTTRDLPPLTQRLR
ncbi:MAG: DUF6607 family protein [Pseudomonadota bacterium]